MPTILVIGAYRLYFYNHEPNEPPHVAADRDDDSAKFWLNQVALARNFGFSLSELRKIQRVGEENQSYLLEKWHEYFPT